MIQFLLVHALDHMLDLHLFNMSLCESKSAQAAPHVCACFARGFARFLVAAGCTAVINVARKWNKRYAPQSLLLSSTSTKPPQEALQRV